MIEQDIIYILEQDNNTRGEVIEKYNLLIEEMDEIQSLTHENIPHIFTKTILQQCDKDMFDELKQNFNENKNIFIENMQESLNTYAYKEQLCPNCGEELEFTYNNEPSYYFGREVYEQIHEGNCPNGCCIK